MRRSPVRGEAVRLTDQFGDGHAEALPFSEAKHLPVSPLEAGDGPLMPLPGWKVSLAGPAHQG